MTKSVAPPKYQPDCSTYVPALDLSYTFVYDRAVFEDGVSYTIEEMVFLSKQHLSNVDIKALHLTKAMFDGVLLHDVEAAQNRTLPSGFGQDCYLQRIELVPDDDLSALGRVFGPMPFLPGVSVRKFYAAEKNKPSKLQALPATSTTTKPEPKPEKKPDSIPQYIDFGLFDHHKRGKTQ